MKIVRRIGWLFLIVITAGAVAVWLYVRSTGPDYTGKLEIEGLDSTVTVYFDDYGIPHVYASRERDACFALGFLHAQERLFQMEMMRRVGAGRLAEVFGPELTGTDVFFRSLGLGAYAREAADEFRNAREEPWWDLASSYVHGINAFIARGKKPVEFTLAGIPLEPFGTEDIFLVAGYMAFTFQESFKTDPVLTAILDRHGSEYLEPFLDSGADIPSPDSVHEIAGGELAVAVSQALEPLPTGPLLGSNAWVVAPERSATGAVLFCNDTHIGYAQPSPWFEAHLETPRHVIYGNFLAGFPFPLVGHTRAYTWGLTILENDDLDFYREKFKPGDSSKYKSGDQWLSFDVRNETIKVKGGRDTVITIRETRRGPLVNDALSTFLSGISDPVSLSWSFISRPATALEATYGLSHARDMEHFRQACAKIEAPGLNVLYGDTAGHIGWWAGGRLLRRPPHVNPKLILDGAGGNDEPSGYFPFDENPSAVNPADGILFSANHLPPPYNTTDFPGYYAPPERAARLQALLRGKRLLTVEDMRRIQADVVNEGYRELARLFAHVIRAGVPDADATILQMLENWDGTHGTGHTGPVIFNKILAVTLGMAMTDELDSAAFAVFRTSHTMKGGMDALVRDETSPWWDRLDTDTVESRADIIRLAYERSVTELRKQLGPEPANWTWGRVHTVEYVHPVGKRKPMDRLFNVGPYAAPGGNETINKSGFALDDQGRYEATLGPAMRILVDMSDPDRAWSVLPTGQSGHFFSRHYDDQASMYLQCQQREMLMERERIMAEGRKLQLVPRQLRDDNR